MWLSLSVKNKIQYIHYKSRKAVNIKLKNKEQTCCEELIIYSGASSPLTSLIQLKQELLCRI